MKTSSVVHVSFLGSHIIGGRKCRCKYHS